MADGFNLNTFRSNLNKNNGLLKNNKFMVRMYAPQGFKNSRAQELNETARFMEFWCESANIPGVSLNVNEVRRYGYGTIEKKPYASLNNDINMSFLGDAKGAIWTYFQQWLRLIVNYDMRRGIFAETGMMPGQSPFLMSYKDDYAVDIYLYVFDDRNNEIFRIVLRDAYPIFVGDVQLNWGDTNSLMRIPVTFTVYDWYNDKIEITSPENEQSLRQSFNPNSLLDLTQQTAGRAAQIVGAATAFQNQINDFHGRITNT